MDLFDALERRRSHRAFAATPVPAATILRLVWAAQGVTGPGGRRTAPSAHALHPLRLRLSIGAADGLAPGLYDADAAPLRLIGDDPRAELADSGLDDPPWLAAAPVVLTICADMAAVAAHFADQPPYGERGPRYAWIEAGAAMQNCLLAAAAQGLAAAPVAGFRDEPTAAALALPPPLAPLCHVCIGYPA